MATLISLSHVHHFLVQVTLSVTLYMYNTTFVGCACLDDVLSFLNGNSSCKFDKDEFTSKFIASTIYTEIGTSICIDPKENFKLSALLIIERSNAPLCASIKGSSVTYFQNWEREYNCSFSTTKMSVCFGNFQKTDSGTFTFYSRSANILTRIILKEADDQQECLSKCSVNSTVPWYTEWSINNNYEIENMIIMFSQTRYRFEWEVNCPFYQFKKVSLTFLCEGKYFYERGIGERCMNSSQCQSVNPDSTCSLSSGKCSCQEGYLWNSTTCIAESSRKDQTVINVGVGLAGILLGILGCLAVMFIRNRRLMEAQNKHDENNSGNMYEEALVQEVQVRKVYQELNSTNTLGREKLDEPEGHGICNQVNENAIELHVLSDDGYCLPHGANADVDSHVASG